jgi:hypothetical protein
MRFKYPHTEAMLGASGKELLSLKIQHLEDQLEASYWASGKWIDLGYDQWLATLHEEAPRTGA